MDHTSSLFCLICFVYYLYIPLVLTNGTERVKICILVFLVHNLLALKIKKRKMQEKYSNGEIDPTPLYLTYVCRTQCTLVSDCAIINPLRVCTRVMVVVMSVCVSVNSLGPNFQHTHNINLPYICNVLSNHPHIVRASAMLV